MLVSSARQGRPIFLAVWTIVLLSFRACSRCFHESAVADLDVEHEGLGAFGQLLGQDRRRDERDAFDRRGHVPERVEFFVGRRDFLALADDRAADVRQDLLEAGERKAHIEARDRLELVERAAAVA